MGTRDGNSVRSHAQKHFIKLYRDGLPLPPKVRESGEGYTLSGAPLDPESAAARPYLSKMKINLAPTQQKSGPVTASSSSSSSSAEGNDTKINDDSSLTIIRRVQNVSTVLEQPLSGEKPEPSEPLSEPSLANNQNVNTTDPDKDGISNANGNESNSSNGNVAR